MRRFQNEVIRAERGQAPFVLLGVTPPQQKGHGPMVQRTEYGLRDCLPPQMAVRSRLSFRNGKHGVEQQNPLVCPVHKVPVNRRGAPAIPDQFFEHVSKRRGNRHTTGHGECQPVCLARTMVGVLPQNANPNLFRPNRGLECRKPIIRTGMANPRIICNLYTRAEV